MQILMMIEILIVPLLILIFGILFRCGIPRKRNRWFGIRNRTTMKSLEAWQYAHRVCGKWLIVLGVILLVLALPVILLCREAAWFIWAAAGFALLSALALWICSRIAERSAKKRFGL